MSKDEKKYSDSYTVSTAHAGQFFMTPEVEEVYEEPVVIASQRSSWLSSVEGATNFVQRFVDGRTPFRNSKRAIRELGRTLEYLESEGVKMDISKSDIRAAAPEVQEFLIKHDYFKTEVTQVSAENSLSDVETAQPGEESLLNNVYVESDATQTSVEDSHKLIIGTCLNLEEVKALCSKDNVPITADDLSEISFDGDASTITADYCYKAIIGHDGIVPCRECRKTSKIYVIML